MLGLLAVIIMTLKGATRAAGETLLLWTVILIPRFLRQNNPGGLVFGGPWRCLVTGLVSNVLNQRTGTSFPHAAFLALLLFNMLS